MSKLLLSIVEMGGYPDFEPLYRSRGFDPQKVHSLRKAQAWLKNNRPALVVTEFHFDPELRDRMSNLESLHAMLQKYAPEAKIIVFLAPEHRSRLQKSRTRCPVFGALDFPVNPQSLAQLIDSACAPVAD